MTTFEIGILQAAATDRIAFQGFLGAYSDLACRSVFPGMASLPCASFEDTFAAVREGRARFAMIPVDNSVAGRVADIHHLLPHGGLFIVGEHFQRVNHQLLALPEAELADLQVVGSHVHALSQCRRVIRQLGLRLNVHADTAGAAKELAETGERSRGVIASALAAEIYGLKILRSNIEDAEYNTTRFLIMARAPLHMPLNETPVVTSLIFRVRNIPAALYKALGGFATNGVNLTKLESYLVGGGFTAAQFYADIDGHPAQRPVRLALEELHFFAEEVEYLGTYPADPFRLQHPIPSSKSYSR
jgi:prephenate dehydratase